MRNKAGEVKYRCKCGEITEFYKLLGTRGKCPRCGVFCWNSQKLNKNFDRSFEIKIVYNTVKLRISQSLKSLSENL